MFLASNSGNAEELNYVVSELGAAMLKPDRDWSKWPEDAVVEQILCSMAHGFISHGDSFFAKHIKEERLMLHSPTVNVECCGNAPVVAVLQPENGTVMDQWSTVSVEIYVEWWSPDTAVEIFVDFQRQHRFYYDIMLRQNAVSWSAALSGVQPGQHSVCAHAGGKQSCSYFVAQAA